MMANMEEFYISLVSILVMKFANCNEIADRSINRFI